MTLKSSSRMTLKSPSCTSLKRLILEPSGMQPSRSSRQVARETEQQGHSRAIKRSLSSSSHPTPITDRTIYTTSDQWSRSANLLDHQLLIIYRYAYFDCLSIIAFLQWLTSKQCRQIIVGNSSLGRPVLVLQNLETTVGFLVISFFDKQVCHLYTDANDMASQRNWVVWECGRVPHKTDPLGPLM